jgi:hypothetical protein
MTGAAGDAVLDLAPLFPAQIARTFFVPVFPHVAAAAERLAAPVALHHRAAGHVDDRDVHAERAHEQPRRGFVAATEQHRAVDGIRAEHFLCLHREEVAMKHRRRLRQHLACRHDRNLHRMPARLQNAALHRVRREAQMHVAGVQIAPGVEDADHRLAHDVLAAPAILLRPRAMTKRAQFIAAIPAPGAELFRSFGSGCVCGGHCDRIHRITGFTRFERL